MCYDMIYWCINWTQYIDWFIIWHGTVHKWSWTILQVLLKTYIRKHFLLVKQIKTCAKTLCVFLSYQPLGGEGEVVGVGVVGWMGVIKSMYMMTSSNGSIFCVTVWPLCGEFPGHRWIPRTKVTGKFPSQRPVTRSFDVLFDLHLNKRLSKQSRRRWFATPSLTLWRHCNVYDTERLQII